MRSTVRGRPHPAAFAVVAALALSALALVVLLSPRPANAQADPCQVVGPYTTCTYEVAGTYELEVPEGTFLAYVEVIGGGGGGAATSSTASGGGGGGGALSQTSVSVEPGSTLEIVVGAGGAGGAAPVTGTPTPTPGGGADGEDGGASSVALDGDMLVIASGGAGGSSNGDGGAGGSDDALSEGGDGGNGTTGDVGGGGGGGAAAWFFGDGADGTDGSYDANSATPAVFGLGGGSLGPGGAGNGAGCTAAGECSPAQAGSVPGGGGGGGGAGTDTTRQNLWDGADGARGEVTVEFISMPVPTVEKTAVESDGGNFLWEITITGPEQGSNGEGPVIPAGVGDDETLGTLQLPPIEIPVFDSPYYVHLVDEDVELLGVEYDDTLRDGPACYQDGADFLCMVFPGETVTLLVARPAAGCDTQSVNLISEANALSYIDLLLALLALIESEEIDSIEDLEALLPGLISDAPPEDVDVSAVVELFEGLGVNWHALDLPAPSTATAPRGEGYCLPDDYIIPLPIPDPVGDPPRPGAEPACELDAGTWTPEPVNPGITISQWGGGNVDDFPLELATSYWTTVNGELVGYIPGAPDFVNAEFMAAFPGGNIPACTAFIVAYR